jgi:hypothetical protein
VSNEQKFWLGVDLPSNVVWTPCVLGWDGPFGPWNVLYLDQVAAELDFHCVAMTKRGRGCPVASLFAARVGAEADTKARGSRIDTDCEELYGTRILLLEFLDSGFMALASFVPVPCLRVF